MIKKRKIILGILIILILSIASFFIFFKKDNIILIYVEGVDIKKLNEYSREQLPNLKQLYSAEINTDLPLNNPSSLVTIMSGGYIYYPWFEKESDEYIVNNQSNLKMIFENTELVKYAEEIRLSKNFFNGLNWDLEKTIHQTNDYNIENIIEETKDDFILVKNKLINSLEEKQDNLIIFGTNYPAIVSQVSGVENDILESYQKIDNLIVGVQNLMKKNTKLFVVSPFGFVDVNKSIDINNALVYRGFLKGDYNSEEDYYLTDCDLRESFAYSPRAGEIFINKDSREEFGKVNNDFEAVIEDTSYVLNFINYEGDNLIDTQLYDTRNYFKQENLGELFIAMPEGYNIFWPENENKILHDIIIDTSLKKDHLNIKPSLIPGFVLSNKDISVKKMSYLDILKLIFPKLEENKNGK